MQIYLDYLRELRFDTISFWTEEDLEFYNHRNFKITNESSRIDKYTSLVDGFKTKLSKGHKYRDLLKGGFSEFNHWLTVAETRAHSIRKDYWMGCKRFKSETDDP